MSVNPWHNVHYGTKSPEIVTAYIEVPANAKVKYELDKSSGLIKVDRVLSSSVVYPANYGLIPQTYYDDGDPLDILVIGQSSVIPGCLMQARTLGYLTMIDGGELDDKIISVHHDDPQYSHINTLEDLTNCHPHLMKEIENFFKTYKLLQNKPVEVKGYKGKESAYEIINKSIKLYENEKAQLLKSV